MTRRPRSAWRGPGRPPPDRPRGTSRRRGRDRSERQGLRARRIALLGHALAEGDRGRLDDAAAGLAVGRLAGRLEARPDPVELVAPPAGQAGRVGAVAVQLDDLVLRDARRPGARPSMFWVITAGIVPSATRAASA